MPTPGLDLAFITVDDNKVTTDLERIKAWSELIQTAIDDVVTGAVPTGPAGGDLTGTYPNPGIAAGVIVNNDVSGSAAIAYSKLALTLAIVNGDISASAAIAYSKLNLAASIVNADVATGAAIAYAKLNLAGSVTGSDIASSVALAGNPTTTTQAANNNSTRVATTAYVDTADALKANLASPTFTGTPSLPTGTTGVTQSAADSTTKLATTAFVTTADNLKANLASPTFTGTPSLPTGTTGVTQTSGDSTTKLATTAFVTAADALALKGFTVKTAVLYTMTDALATNTRSGDVLTASATGFFPNSGSVNVLGLSGGERILVAGEGGGTDLKNGIYTVTDYGSLSTPWVLTRSVDATTGTLSSGAYVTTLNPKTLYGAGVYTATGDFYLATSDPITVNTTALTWPAVKPVLPDWGTVYQVPLYGAVASTVATANQTYYAPVQVLNRQTFTGVRYQVGGVSSGNVRSSVYNSAGTRVADRTTNAAQSAALAVQDVAFSSAATLEAGLYWVAITFSSATATYLGGASMLPSGNAAGAGSGATKTSITVPTATAASCLTAAIY